MTELTLEAPGGLVEVRADCRDGKAERISVQQPAELRGEGSTPSLEVEGLGTLTVDTAYGGDSFVIVDAGALGFALVADEAHDIARLGVQDHRRRQCGARLPASGRTRTGRHISFCLFAGPLDATAEGLTAGRRRGDPARQDRPLAHGHGALGAHGGAPRARPDAERRDR